MTKFQYMVLIAGVIFLVLLLIIFGVLVQITFTKNTVKKKKSPCPDYWEEVKDVNVVDVFPNKEYIYKDKQQFNGTQSANIGNNDVQNIQIMTDTNEPLIRIINEKSKNVTACKVPLYNGINVGYIYKTNNNIPDIRNFRHGSGTIRNNYTTTDKIPITGGNADITYNTNGKYYSIVAGDSALITGDTILSDNVIKTPGFYWKTECKPGTSCYTTDMSNNIKIWGNEYSNTKYTPTEYYIDFKDNDWHAINMNKSINCNLRDWANRNAIEWDGITNMAC